MGFSRISRHFPGFGFFLFQNIILARPAASNARRWAFPCKAKSYEEFLA
jgi:hypothetical protein